MYQKKAKDTSTFINPKKQESTLNKIHYQTHIYILYNIIGQKQHYESIKGRVTNDIFWAQNEVRTIPFLY